MRKVQGKHHFDFSSRTSGILLHLTSLPGKHGAGDLGPEAHRFCELMEKAGQSWWQMLPVGPPGNGPGFSPYDSCSGFAGNPYLISISLLAKDGLLSADDIIPEKVYSGSRVSFSEVHRYKDKKLRQAFKNFIELDGRKGKKFKDFCNLNGEWLDDFALFMALKNESGGKPWTLWQDDLRTRRPEALKKASLRLADEIVYQSFLQFKFESQWRDFRTKSHQHGIGLIGDVPIFVGHNSADVWSHQELFQLDAEGEPLRVSGYPPDRFSTDGQRWGHPQYQWSAHQLNDFNWWVLRFARLFSLFDAIRIDHFLGFNRTWSIPASSRGAKKGRWVKSPGRELFLSVTKKLGPRPLIAEDLGRVTPADILLRDEFGMLPMRIFQFGFGTEKDSSDHLPHNYRSVTAAYTGNHDNNTIRGWFSNLPQAQKRTVMDYTGGQASTFNWDSMRTLQGSAASLVIFPLQDILNLDSGSRMNIPGTTKGNWSWRLDSAVPLSVIKKLRRQTELFGRIRPHEF
jgi:4-alpha-glucanotransferase